MYLSQLTLNPRSRQVQSELARPYELHRTLMRAFPDDVKREDADLLHRLDTEPRTGRLTLLAQSMLEPDWSPLLEAGQGHYLLAPPQCKPIKLALPAGRVLRFRLVANPTIKKVRRDENGVRRKNGNRVPLLRETEQIDWLQKKGQLHGFGLQHAQVRALGQQTSRKRKLTLYTVQFEGLLEITDPQNFAQALQTGIGPAKAFGCGLLSLAPA